MLLAVCAAASMIGLSSDTVTMCDIVKNNSDSGVVSTSDQGLSQLSEETPIKERVVVVYRDGGSFASLGLTKDDVDARNVVSDSVNVLHPANGDADALIARLKSNQHVESVFVDDIVPRSAAPSTVERN